MDFGWTEAGAIAVAAFMGRRAVRALVTPVLAISAAASLAAMFRPR